MKLLSLLIRASLPLFITSAVASMLTGLFSTLTIKEIHAAINGEYQTANEFIGWFLTLIAGYLLFSVIASVSISFLTKRIVHNLRIDLTNSIIKADYSHLENLKAKLLPVLTDDISTIGIVIERLPSVANGIATVLGLLIYMTWLSPTLSLLTLGALLVIVAINKFSLHFIAKYSKLSREYTNKVYEAFEGLVYGLKSLKVNSKFRGSYIHKTVIPGSIKQTKYYLYDNVFNATTNRLNDVVLFLFLGIVIVGVFMFNFVSMDFFNKYLTLILFMLAPLSTISGFFSTMKKIEASVYQIDQLGIDVNKEVEASELAEDEPLVITDSTNSNIDLDQLSYTHSDGENSFRLGPISLTITHGEITFITGGNGSGKTTLIKAIAGLYQPEEGHISYRGVQISKANLTAYRDLFAVIFTDGFIFNHLHHIPEQELEQRGPELLKLLNLHKKVNIENGKLTTVNLSEGQKKRLALFKALLEDKKIYVFDEWVAYQDKASKELFFYTILPYLKEQGKTVINISHDSGFEDVADATIHLQFGKVDRIS